MKLPTPISTVRAALAALVALALVAACGQDPESATIAPGSATTQPGSEDFEFFDPFMYTVNIEVTEDGFSPEALFIPVNRPIQLIFRNRTTAEHHYRVQGMETTEMVWMAEPWDGVIEEGVSEEDHMLHHITGFVDWRGTSPAGVRPTLDEVHVYAVGGNVDIIRFTATSVGEFPVDDPLYPEFTAEVTVFE